MLLDIRIGTESVRLLEQQTFDGVGERFVVLGLDWQSAEIEYQTLPRPEFGAPVLNEMQIRVAFIAARVTFADALDVPARETYRAYPRVSIIF